MTTSNRLVLLTILTFISTLPNFVRAETANVVEQDDCRAMTSCSSCITKSDCVWCVTKSICTKQSCGNDNIIYPKDITALMSGPNFCPKVVASEPAVVVSGKKKSLSVKITQIHLYMAFTPWKCRIVLGPNEITVNAMLLGDTVFCEAYLFKNESHEPYVDGHVTVLWDYSKAFDGTMPFKVCRCDLDPACVACTQ